MTEIERENLQKYRELYHVSTHDHEEMLKDLDWTIEEFDAGFKG